jgi:DNA ligase (NAD+)
MPHRIFERINQQKIEAGEAPMANPRNAAAGTLKMQNSSLVAKRGLDCFLYYMLGDNLPSDSHSENLQFAKNGDLRYLMPQKRLKILMKFLSL